MRGLVGRELTGDDGNRESAGTERPHAALQYIRQICFNRFLDSAKSIDRGHRVVGMRPAGDGAVPLGRFVLDGSRRGAKRADDVLA